MKNNTKKSKILLVFLFIYFFLSYSNIYSNDNNCHAVYKDGKLHIPCVDVPGPFGGIQVYSVDMNLVPSSNPITFIVTGASIAQVKNENKNIYKSCYDILKNNPDSKDGIYTIDPDEDGPIEPFKVYCDMTKDGGGWTLIAWNSIKKEIPQTSYSKHIFDDQIYWENSDLGINSKTRILKGNQIRMQWESEDGTQRSPRFYNIPPDRSIKDGFKGIPPTDTIKWEGAALSLRITEDSDLSTWDDNTKCEKTYYVPANSTKDGRYYVIIHDYVGCVFKAGSYWSFAQHDGNNRVYNQTYWYENGILIKKEYEGRITAWIK